MEKPIKLRSILLVNIPLYFKLSGTVFRIPMATPDEFKDN